MINQNWPRVAAVHSTSDGKVAAVWMAYERDTDSVHLYDACLFNREVLPVIAEGVNARGRFIPVAWAEKEKAMADDLLKRGCRMMVDAISDDDAMAEIVSRTIWERMRTGRFKVDVRLAEWLDEAKGFQRVDGKVPRAGYPLMTATRYALQMLDQGRKPESAVARKALYPKKAVV